ncbi:MAG: DUF2213 domain-containing protein [Elusimicrobia bacterium]|nr:DUF2213 domain-containing protein [Elusimicrobiota bacterium]
MSKLLIAEPTKDAVSRLLASPAAQRLPAGHRIALNDGATWPRRIEGKILEPGLVHYADWDNPLTKSKGATVLLTKAVIDAMRATAEGKPIVDAPHAEADPDWFKQGKADGIATRAFFNPDSAWETLEGLVWDEETLRHCREGYEFSCGYYIDDIDWTPGLHHQLPYDGVIKRTEYNHFIVTPNPRYKGATIQVLNSLEKPKMNPLIKAVLNCLPRAEVKMFLNEAETEDAKKAKEKDEADKLAAKNAEETAAKEKKAKEDKEAADKKKAENDAAAALVAKNAADAAAAETARIAAKNASDEAARVQAENAAKVAADKAAADAAAKEAFNALERARQTQQLPEFAMPLSREDRLKLGKERY